MQQLTTGLYFPEVIGTQMGHPNILTQIHNAILTSIPPNPNPIAKMRNSWGQQTSGHR